MNIKYTSLVFVCFIGLCGFLFTSFYKEAKEESIERLEKEQLLYVQQTAQGIEHFFAHWITTLKILAETEHIKKMDNIGKEIIERVHNENDELITAVARLDAKGRIIHISPFDENYIGRDISSAEHISEIMKSHSPVVSNVYSAIHGKDSIALHVPVFNGGTYQGTIGITINFSALAWRYLGPMIIGVKGFSWVLNRDGVELFCPVPGHEGNSVFAGGKKCPGTSEMLDKMLHGHTGKAVITVQETYGGKIESVKKYAVYMPVMIENTFWSILVASSEDDALSSLKGFRNKLIIIICLILLGGLLFSFYWLKAFFIIREDDKRRQAEEALKLNNILLSTQLETSIDGILVVDENAKILSYNKQFARMWNIPDDIIEKGLDEPVLRLVTEQTAKPGKFLEKVNYLYEHRQEKSRDEIALSDGRTFDRYSAPMIGLDNRYFGRIWYFRDITPRKILELKLRTASITDDLTGLYNRRGFFTLAQQQIKIAERAKKDMLLCFVDLDGMKSINDTFGHVEGDNAIVEVASILKTTFRESDIIGRMGGDEFAVLVIDATYQTKEILVKRLCSIIKARNEVEKKFQLSLSIGVECYDADCHLSIDEIVAKADSLMYEEKRRKQIQ